MFSTTKLFQVYKSILTFTMALQSIVNTLLPHELKTKIISFFKSFLPSQPNMLTLIINEDSSNGINEVYQAAESYLPTIIGPSTHRFHVSRIHVKDKQYKLSVPNEEEVLDTFENFQVVWKFVDNTRDEFYDTKRHFELMFDKKFKDKVINSYLPYVENQSNEIRNKNKVVMLYSYDYDPYDDDEFEGRYDWYSIRLDHPASFDALAMHPDLKKIVIDDMERFVKRREYYRRVGKAWKRGYFVYGPPGSGKSSLIAAMANYLKFDIYELDLTTIFHTEQLKTAIFNMVHRSILVVEDIDYYNSERQEKNRRALDFKVALTSVLTMSDGLWSTIGEEKIVVFTTNHKDKVDPALVRPGKMDMHINLSYCTINVIGQLAYKYHGVEGNHPLFSEIEELIQKVNVLPAEVAGEMMKSCHADSALESLVQLLKRKNMEMKDAKKLKCLENVKQSESEGKGEYEKNSMRVQRKEMKRKKAKEQNYLRETIKDDVNLRCLQEEFVL